MEIVCLVVYVFKIDYFMSLNYFKHCVTFVLLSENLYFIVNSSRYYYLYVLTYCHFGPLL
jgi:hypothetical protein